MNTCDIVILMSMALFVVMTLQKKLEGYNLLDGNLLDNKFYGPDKTRYVPVPTNWKSTVHPHEYASGSWRTKHYNQVKSYYPWLEESEAKEKKEGFGLMTDAASAQSEKKKEEPFDFLDQAKERLRELKARYTPAKKNHAEGWRDVSAPGQPGKFAPGSQELQASYEFNLENALKPECVKEMVDSYYFDPLPYIEKEQINNKDGRYERLRY